MQSNNIISNILCQENNIVFFPENNSVTKSFSGNHGENSYTNCLYSSKDTIDNSFKIDCFNFKKAADEKLNLFFITLAEQDRRISVPTHDKHCKRFFEIIKKTLEKKAKIEWARRREINIKNNIHSHFWLMCKGIDSETVNNIWKKITGYENASDCQGQYDAYGHRRYICKKAKHLEKSDKQIKRKFSYSKGFSSFLKKQEITINNGYRNIGTIIFSNDSVKVELLKTKKSKAIDGHFAEFLRPFKKTLKFRTNDLYGFTALNEKQNFIKFFELEKKIIWYPETLYFISVNGNFKLTYFTEYLENKSIG